MPTRLAPKASTCTSATLCKTKQRASSFKICDFVTQSLPHGMPHCGIANDAPWTQSLNPRGLLQACVVVVTGKLAPGQLDTLMEAFKPLVRTLSMPHSVHYPAGPAPIQHLSQCHCLASFIMDKLWHSCNIVATFKRIMPPGEHWVKCWHMPRAQAAPVGPRQLMCATSCASGSLTAQKYKFCRLLLPLVLQCCQHTVCPSWHHPYLPSENGNHPQQVEIC